MKNIIPFLFGIHMHQPVDNFGNVLEEAVRKCYFPFFKTVSRYPEFKFSVHCSGWLLEQVQLHFPELFSIMKQLSDAGSLEFLSGGYYEPILCSIPSIDRIGQIKKLTNSIKKNFHQTACGIWLTERVWEESIVGDLNSCGIDYTLVDDYHFLCAGFNKDELQGYYLTEDDGKNLAIFPINKDLRYAIPFKTVDKAINIIKKNGAAIIFDDAEKFGLWPHTYDWVYEKGWLDNFIRKILEHPLIEPMQYNYYLKHNKPLGIAYLPNVSYYEMGQWSLNADDAVKLETLRQQMGKEQFEEYGVKFLKGGVWKNFFHKYSESNHLHKRMIEHSLLQGTTKDKQFKENLYKAQTNDVFWHGIFGGLYLPNLRDNAYRYLIKCDNIRYKNGDMFIERKDINCDGSDEIRIVTKKLNYIISPIGGQIIEFDDREKLFNFQNVITRRKEAYHEKMLTNMPDNIKTDEMSSIHSSSFAVDKTIKAALHFDWYNKNSFIDHISDKSFNLKNFHDCSFREYGDFVNMPYESNINGRLVSYERKGGIYMKKEYDTDLKKQYLFKDDGFEFKLELDSSCREQLVYAVECNLHFANLRDVMIEDKFLGNEGRIDDIKQFSINDSCTDKKIAFSFSTPFDLIYYPLETISQSELGYNKTIQGVSIAAVFPFKGRLSFSCSVLICRR